MIFVKHFGNFCTKKELHRISVKLFLGGKLSSRLRIKLLRRLEKIVRSKEANLRAGGDSERSEDL